MLDKEHVFMHIFRRKNMDFTTFDGLSDGLRKNINVGYIFIYFVPFYMDMPPSATKFWPVV